MSSDLTASLNKQMRASLARIMTKKLEAAREGMQDAAVYGVFTAKRRTNKVDAVAFGIYKAAWAWHRDGKDAFYVENDAPHAAFVEHGRPPGLAGPSVADIEAWLIAKHRGGKLHLSADMEGSNKDIEAKLKGMAPAVAKTIHERGTAPKGIAKYTAEQLAKRLKSFTLLRVKKVKG